MTRESGDIDSSETFDESLEKEGLLVECEEIALKKVIAAQTAAMNDDAHSRSRSLRERMDRRPNWPKPAWRSPGDGRSHGARVLATRRPRL